MFRLYYNIFWGTDRHYHHTPHEAPAIMTIPLLFLAVASVFSGFLPFSHMVTSDGKPFEAHTDMMVAIPSVVIALIGITIATVMYKKPSTLPDKVAGSIKGLYKASLNKFWFDEIYLFVTKRIIFAYISRPIAWFDRHVVDATMNLVGWTVTTTSNKIKGLQSGQLQQYAMVFVYGVVILTLLFVYLISK